MPYIVDTVFLELLLSGHVRTMYKCSLSASRKVLSAFFLEFQSLTLTHCGLYDKQESFATEALYFIL